MIKNTTVNADIFSACHFFKPLKLNFNRSFGCKDIDLCSVKFWDAICSIIVIKEMMQTSIKEKL